MAGSGPVLKKKDRVALSLSQEQSVGPSDNDILQEQLAEVTKQLKQTQQRLKESERFGEERWRESDGVPTKHVPEHTRQYQAAY